MMFRSLEVNCLDFTLKKFWLYRQKYISGIWDKICKNLKRVNMQDGKGRRASVVILLCPDYFQAINFLTGGRTMPGFWLVENKFYSLFCNYTPYTKETFMRYTSFRSLPKLLV